MIQTLVLWFNCHTGCFVHISPEISLELAKQAGIKYFEVIFQGLDGLILACDEGFLELAAEYVDSQLYQKRRDILNDFPIVKDAWKNAIAQQVVNASEILSLGQTVNKRALFKNPLHDDQITLVEDNVIELDIAVSRLDQAISEKSGWQYTDLNARLVVLHGEERIKNELLPNISGTTLAKDFIKPGLLARWVVDAWAACGLTVDQWKIVQTVIHDEFSYLAEQAYLEANRLLLSRGVKPEIDLRPFVKRSKVGIKKVETATSQNSKGNNTSLPSSTINSNQQANHQTDFIGRAINLTDNLVQKQKVVLESLTDWVGKLVPDFAILKKSPTDSQKPSSLSTDELNAALMVAQQAAKSLAEPKKGEHPNSQELVQDLYERSKSLKKIADTPAQRATIEIVALLFQSLLTQERLPAQIRIWFARLQIPVLRVAIIEPAFFAAIDHPARVLIDRMGGCVMGFGGNEKSFEEDELHHEIRRIVQVIEAYPDTESRVFVEVLKEFEDFLEVYFKDNNSTTRVGVSLAQQLEQREAFSIQYIIELRKMLQDVPVHDAIREFLFKVWADVMGQCAVQTSPSSDSTRSMQRIAHDLIWLASAKTTQEERSQVLLRLPPLLRLIRAGMGSIGLPQKRQEEHIQSLNAAFLAGFSAKTKAMTDEHLQAVSEKLQALDDLMPELEGVELDEDIFRDLSGYESSDLEVVADGGSIPSPDMLTVASELHLGHWFLLDYRGKQERVQFVWQGLQRNLMLFSTVHGRGVLFQVHRLAAFMQAKLLVPEQNESLTVIATRSALEKLNADPQRLLG